MDLTSLGYREIAERYDLGSLKEGGDLQLTDDGDLALTLDGDLKLGNDQHNALHRVAVRWQMEAPVLSSMFESVLGGDEKKKTYEAMIAALLAGTSLDEDTAADVMELQEAIGANISGPGNPAGAIAIAINNLLRREWVDLGRPASWETAGRKIAGHSLGRVMEAAANNFRHSDEWARVAVPNSQQLDSIRVIADVLGVRLAPNGATHPFRTNVCPKLLLVVSAGTFEGLMDRTFGFARALAGL